MEFPLKNGTTRVVAKNVFFFAKTGGKSTWRTRTPHFLHRLPGSGFFREGILRVNDKLIEFLQIGKTAVVRRPLFASPICEAIIWAHWVVLYWLTSTWLTRTPYFLEFCFCICIFCMFMYFLYFFVVGCLGHDFLDGLRSP